MRQDSPPRGMFKGKNFMTPNVESYWSLTVNGQEIWAEISTGRGISNQPIVGVTVRPDAHSKLSRLFQSRRLALDYLEELESGAAS